jgi:anti-sigma-K factor RskA
MSEHEDLRDDLAAYALGALPDEEAAALERHLRECGRCRAELEWLRPAVELIPESVPQLDPPARMRERILREVRSDSEALAPDVARGRERPAWRSLMLRPAIGLAALALLAAGVAGYAVRGGGEGAETIAAPSDPGEPAATLTRLGDSGTLELARLRRLPPSRAYQAWVEREGRLVPSSVFLPDADGAAGAAIPRGLDGAEAVMVTIEPRGGSEHPTSDPILAIRLD